jgi:two-component system sensor histidine kinase AlgZ
VAAIIKQNRFVPRLPDLRNLGVILRIVLIVNVLGLAAAIALSRDWRTFASAALDIAALLEPVLMAELVALYALSPLLLRVRYWHGIAIAIATSLVVGEGALYAYRRLWPATIEWQPRYLALVFLVTAIVLAYFNLRERALSPALSEARLQALQARIRPHFLFNSINAVLSLVRSEPARAEVALQDLAELFRVLMADNRELTPLADEVELCKQYLDLEKLRLGERLQVVWHIEKMPGRALVPPLVLQPLLENAVYHGIEPSSRPGEIEVNIFLRRGQVHAVLRNPYQQNGGHHGGNKMALENIRERLALHFDVEADLQTTVTNDSYQVHITMPYREAQVKRVRA